MKAKILVFVFVMVSVSNGFAQFQYWYATDNYDWPAGLTMEPNGGYFVAGSTLSGTWYPFLMRVDKAGKFLWGKTYDLQSIDEHFWDVSIIPGTDRVAAVGSADGEPALGTSFDDYMVVAAGDGTVLRAKRFYTTEGDVARHITPVTNSVLGKGFAIAGYTYHNQTTFEKDMHIVLTNLAGTMVNSAVYLNPFNQEARWVAPTKDDGYILVGETETQGSCDNDEVSILVVRLNSSLNVIWDRTFDLRSAVGYTEDKPYAVAEDNNGEIHVVGTSSIYINGVLDHDEPFQLHLKKDGSFIWAKLYQTKSYSGLQTVSFADLVRPDGTNEYVLAGRAINPFEALLFKTDGNGDVIWAKTYPASYSTSFTNAEALITNKIDGFSFTGRRFNGASPSTGYDIHLVETNADGRTGESCENKIEITNYKVDACVGQLYLKEKKRMYELNVSPIVQSFDPKTYDCAEQAVSAVGGTSERISPDPVETIITIANYAGEEVMVYDLQGVLQKKATAVRDGQLDVSDLPKGLYVLKLIDRTGATQEFRFIKN